MNGLQVTGSGFKWIESDHYHIFSYSVNNVNKRVIWFSKRHNDLCNSFVVINIKNEKFFSCF